VTTPPRGTSPTTFAAFKAAERAREERHTLAVERRVLGLVGFVRLFPNGTWKLSQTDAIELSGHLPYLDYPQALKYALDIRHQLDTFEDNADDDYATAHAAHEATWAIAREAVTADIATATA